MTPSSIRLRSDVLAASFLAVTLGLAPAALAEGACKENCSEERHARAEFVEGTKSYDMGEFDAALRHFSEAYSAKPLPGFLFNIAQCHRQLNHPERAAFFYRRYLDALPNAPNAGTARELLAEMDARADQKLSDQQRQQVADERKREEENRELAQARASGALSPASTSATGTASAPKDGLARKWWFWTTIGVVVAGGATTGIVLATQPKPAVPSLGTVNSR